MNWQPTSKTPEDGESIWIVVQEWDGIHRHVDYAVAFSDVDGMNLKRSEEHESEPWPPKAVTHWMPVQVPPMPNDKDEAFLSAKPNTSGATCSTCNYWILDKDDCDNPLISPQDPVTLEQEETEEAIVKKWLHAVRRCRCPKITFNQRPEHDGAAVRDGEGYAGELLTGPDFGCIHHESNKPVQGTASPPPDRQRSPMMRDGPVQHCCQCLWMAQGYVPYRPTVLHNDGFHYHDKSRCKRRADRGSPPRKCRCKDCRANAPVSGVETDAEKDSA